MQRAILAPRARRELAEAVEWIARDSRAAARGLRESVDRALTMIGTHPHSGSRRPEIAADPIRFHLLAGYPYLLVYLSDRQPPVVARLIHGARDLEQLLGDAISPSPRRS
jgi:toxin ParE1/3/4